MSQKVFCDFCERDITKHDRFHVRLDSGERNILTRRFGQWDVCVSCARTLDLNTLIKDDAP